MPKKTDQPMNFENSQQELANIVKALEKGDLSLEQALEHYEKGIRLSRECQTLLKEAEQRVEHADQVLSS